MSNLNKQVNHIILFLFVFFFVSTNLFSQDWTLKYDKEKIKVYTKATTKSDMDEFRGVALIDAPMEVVTELLRDVSEYDTWVYNCENAEIIKKQSNDDFVVYYVYDCPWPVDDRWVVLQAKSEIDCANVRVVIKMYSIDHDIKNKSTSDMVKMAKMTGDYTLEYVSRNQTLVTYTIFADPGGSVPANLANMASVDIPFETLKAMKEMVKKEKYIKAAKTSTDKVLIDNCLSKKNKTN